MSEAEPSGGKARSKIERSTAFLAGTAITIGAVDVSFVLHNGPDDMALLFSGALLCFVVDVLAFLSLGIAARGATHRAPVWFASLFLAGVGGACVMVTSVASLPAAGVAVVGVHGFSIVEPGFIFSLIVGLVFTILMGLAFAGSRWRSRAAGLVYSLVIMTGLWTSYPAARLGVGIFANGVILVSIGVAAGICSHFWFPSKQFPRSALNIGLPSALLIVLGGLFFIPPPVLYVAYEGSRVATKLLEVRRLGGRATDTSPVSKSGAIPLEEPKDDLRGIVVVLIDTLRYDIAVDPTVAPNLARFRDESVSFSRAYVTYPSTRVSTTSMLGQLPDGVPLGAELRERGIRSVAVTSHPHVAEVLGSFDEVVPVGEGDLRFQTTAANAFAQASERLQTLASEPTRFVLVVHVLDPHEYYVEHEGHSFGVGRMARYKSEVAHVDALLGEFLRENRARFGEEDAAIVVTSDHGEELGDTGYYSHGLRIIDETVRVPFFFSHPGFQSAEVTVPVSMSLLPQTILAVVDSESSHTDSVFREVGTPHFFSGSYRGCVIGSRKVIQNIPLDITVEFELSESGERLLRDSTTVCWEEKDRGEPGDSATATTLP